MPSKSKDAVRVYVDTSVFGGVFDEEFMEGSRAFFNEVRAGQFQIVISEVVIGELIKAPEEIRSLYFDMEKNLELLSISEKAIALGRAYLERGIVGEKWNTDALHVALATVGCCKAIVSWNFRHIVHFEKIPWYNEVNTDLGFGSIAIHTPWEVLHYDDDGKNI